jgi:hypothetical protein
LGYTAVPGRVLARSPSGTAAGPPAAPPQSDRGAAAAPSPAGPHFAPASPSQPSIIGALQRSVETAWYSAIEYTERSTDAGIELSVGSAGDGYDDAPVETVIGLFKTEVIRRRRLGAVDFTALERVDRFTRRLPGPIGHARPDGAEAAHHEQIDRQRAVSPKRINIREARNGSLPRRRA